MNNFKKQQVSELPLFETIENKETVAPQTKNIRIPDEDVKLRLHELIVINTRTFQRLFSIKQLGLAYFIYPFATHTRGAHSISCLSWAQKIIDSLEVNLLHSNFPEKKYFLNHVKKNKNAIRLTALLHDISHIPFSHTLEDENLIFEEHDKSERLRIIMNHLKNDINSLDKLECPQLFFRLSEEKYSNMKKDLTKKLETVKKILNLNNRVEGLTNDEKDMYYIADIIGNTICADLLSYIEKDAQIAGTGGKAAGIYRLFDYFQIRRDKKGKARLTIKLTKEGYPRHDVIPIISEILNKRYAISYQVTYHHAKLAASAMLGKIIRLIDLKEGEKLYRIGDEGFLNLLEQEIEGRLKSISNAQDRKNFKGAKKLLENLRSRRFYKRFYIIPYAKRRIYNIGNLKEIFSRSDGYNELKALEREIIEKLDLDPEDVIFFAPRIEFKEAGVTVSYEESRGREEVVRLDSKDCKDFITEAFDKSLADEISILKNKYNALWKFYVFINPERIRLYGKEILERLDNMFEKQGIPQFKDYWDKSDEFKISNELFEKIEIKNFNKRAKIYQKIPSALKEMVTRSKIKRSENKFFTSEIIESIIEKAIDLASGKNK